MRRREGERRESPVFVVFLRLAGASDSLSAARVQFPVADWPTTTATPTGRGTEEKEGEIKRERQTEWGEGCERQRGKNTCRWAEMDLPPLCAGFVARTARWKIPWGNGDVIRRIEVKWHFQDHHVQSSQHEVRACFKLHVMS